MTTLEQAEIDLKAKEKDFYAQRNLVSELISKQELPNVIDRYEGKYFKFRNSYSSPDKGWWLYMYVKKVTGIRYLTAIQVEKDSHGAVKLSIEEHLPISMCEVEITRDEYLIEINHLKEYVDSVLPIYE